MRPAPLPQVAPDSFSHPPGVPPKTPRRQLPWHTQGWPAHVLVSSIQQCAGKKKHVCRDFAPLPAIWHDLKSADLAAKISDRFPDWS
jgi:hypothetical protein